METDNNTDPLEPLKREPEEYKEILKRILQLESEKIYQDRPHLNEDVVRIIKEIIK